MIRHNILIVAHSDGPPFPRIYSQYVKLFDPKQYAVTILYLKKTNQKAELLDIPAEQVIFLEQPHLKGLKIQTIRKLVNICRPKKFDLVICHRYKPTYIMLWVAQFCTIPTMICIMHDMHTMQSIYRQWIIALLFRRNMLIAGVSHAVQVDLEKSLKGILCSKQIITLHNSIEILYSPTTAPWPPSLARKALKLVQNDFVFATIARLVPAKDPFSLIRAFALIATQCPKAKLISFGTGPLEAELKMEIQQLGLNEKIILLGFVPEASRYMQAFDCFVLPSISEAFGMTLLEALRAKIPIITTHTGGITEIIHHQIGSLTPPQDPQTLAKHMCMVYQQSRSEQKKKTEAGYLHVKKYFSTHSFYNQFWRLPLLRALRSF